MKTKKIYNPPITEMVEVEFEGGFMVDSQHNVDEEIFNNNSRSGDISIEGHAVGNEGDYTDMGWDNNSF